MSNSHSKPSPSPYEESRELLSSFDWCDREGRPTGRRIEIVLRRSSYATDAQLVMLRPGQAPYVVPLPRSAVDAIGVGVAEFQRRMREAGR